MRTNLKNCESPSGLSTKKRWIKPEIVMISSGDIEKGRIVTAFEHTIKQATPNRFLTKSGGSFSGVNKSDFAS